MGNTEAIVLLVIAFMGFTAFAIWNLRDRSAGKRPLETPEEIREFLRIYKECEEEEKRGQHDAKCE